MAPHLCYLGEMGRLPWKAAAHITGGGIPGNLPRVLPQGLAAVIRKDAWKPNPIFAEIQRRGGVTDDEMWGTFNMGLGMVLVMDPNEVPTNAIVVGKVVEQSGPDRVEIR
jgi:phosphoribosylformylglycinamidine cyclo-ligase